jgi:predicted amidohydrolase
MVRIAIVQAGSVLFDKNASIQKVREFAKRAADDNADLILFPGTFVRLFNSHPFTEAFVGGYPKHCSFGITLGSRTDEGREEFQRYFENSITFEGKESDELASIAAEYKLYLVVGVVERDGYTLYCSVTHISSFVSLCRFSITVRMVKDWTNTES